MLYGIVDNIRDQTSFKRVVAGTCSLAVLAGFSTLLWSGHDRASECRSRPATILASTRFSGTPAQQGERKIFASEIIRDLAPGSHLVIATHSLDDQRLSGALDVIFNDCAPEAVEATWKNYLTTPSTEYVREQKELFFAAATKAVESHSQTAKVAQKSIAQKLSDLNRALRIKGIPADQIAYFGTDGQPAIGMRPTEGQDPAIDLFLLEKEEGLSASAPTDFHAELANLETVTILPTHPMGRKDADGCALAANPATLAIVIDVTGRIGVDGFAKISDHMATAVGKLSDGDAVELRTIRANPAGVTSVLIRRCRSNQNTSEEVHADLLEILVSRFGPSETWQQDHSPILESLALLGADQRDPFAGVVLLGDLIENSPNTISYRENLRLNYPTLLERYDGHVDALKGVRNLHVIQIPTANTDEIIPSTAFHDLVRGWSGDLARTGTVLDLSLLPLENNS